jgi:hypothetical protein
MSLRDKRKSVEEWEMPCNAMGALQVVPRVVDIRRGIFWRRQLASG